MTDKEASQLIEEFHVPLHVRRHCAAVANFAIKIGEKLAAAGEKIDIALLRHAALLHDLVRVVDFRKFEPKKFPDPVTQNDVDFWRKLRAKYSGLHHAEACAQILEERGFRDVAAVVQKHGFLQIQKGFNTWEEKILYYADKRAKHDTIVSLKERLDEGRNRNAPETEESDATKELDAKVFALEQEIAMKIGGIP